MPDDLSGLHEKYVHLLHVEADGPCPCADCVWRRRLENETPDERALRIRTQHLDKQLAVAKRTLLGYKTSVLVLGSLGVWTPGLLVYATILLIPMGTHWACCRQLRRERDADRSVSRSQTSNSLKLKTGIGPSTISVVELRCCECGILVPVPSYALSKKNRAIRKCKPCRAEIFRANGRSKSEQNAQIEITPATEQIIVGSVLGDGGLERSPNGGEYGLAIKHGLKQASYLLSKAQVLGSLVSKVDYPTDRIRLRTVKHPFISEIARESMGDFGRLLDRLGYLGLAIWYLDDGSVQQKQVRKSGYVDKTTVRFSSCDLSDTETSLARAWFKDFVGVETTVCSWRNPRDLTKPYKGIRLYGDNAIKLLELLDPFIQKLLPYKALTIA